MSNGRTIDMDQAAAMFKALSNPQRLRIFLKFCQNGTGSSCEANDDGIACCVADLGGDLGLAPSTVSHHIKELRQAGLLQVERRGQRIECRIRDEVLPRLAFFFDHARDGKRRVGPPRKNEP